MSKTPGTKTAKLRAMLKRPSGASIEAICKATGWQAHSARAALSGLRKAGCELERRRPDSSQPATYHLVAEPKALT